MKKDVTPVPKDKFLLDFLADMGERTRNAWIFLQYDDVKKLHHVADDYTHHVDSGVQELIWNATDVPKRLLRTEYSQNILGEKVWLKVLRIDAKNIAFHLPVGDPDEILFLKMDE